jgi:hypothetical protein
LPTEEEAALMPVHHPDGMNAASQRNRINCSTLSVMNENDCVTGNGLGPSSNVDRIEGVKTPSQGVPDFCPHCRSPLEIIDVRFRFRGAAVIATCPNCAITRVDEFGHDSAKKLAIASGFVQRVARMQSLDRRFRYVLVFLIGAVITAAALRHIVHVYGGIAREEIRWGAIMAVPLVTAALVFLRRRRDPK